MGWLPGFVRRLTANQFPIALTRQKIEHQVAKTDLEHLIIFTDCESAPADLVLGAARNGQARDRARALLVRDHQAIAASSRN